MSQNRKEADDSEDGEGMSFGRLKDLAKRGIPENLAGFGNYEVWKKREITRGDPGD